MPLLTDAHRDYIRSAIRINPSKPLLSLFKDVKRSRCLLPALTEIAVEAEPELKLAKLLERLLAELSECFAGPNDGPSSPYPSPASRSALDPEEIDPARLVASEPGCNLHDLLMDARINPARALTVLDSIARDEPERLRLRERWTRERRVLEVFAASQKREDGLIAVFFSGILYDWWGVKSTVLFILTLMALMICLIFSQDISDYVRQRWWGFEWQFP